MIKIYINKQFFSVSLPLSLSLSLSLSLFTLLHSLLTLGRRRQRHVLSLALAIPLPCHGKIQIIITQHEHTLPHHPPFLKPPHSAWTALSS